MMDEPEAGTPGQKEYRIRSWRPRFAVADGIVFIIWAIFLIATSFGADGGYFSRHDRFMGFFWLCFGVYFLAQGALWWGYRVTIDEAGLRVHSLVLDRYVRWDDVQWCHVHDFCRRFELVIGRPSGRPLSVSLHPLRPRGEVLTEILSRVKKPRFINVRQSVYAAVFLLPVVALFAAIEVSPLSWPGACVVGLVSGLGFARNRISHRGRAAWSLTLVVGAAVALAAWGVSSWLHGPAGWRLCATTAAVIGGWLLGFMLVRMHEEKMRGTPGADWARETESLPDYAPR